MYVAYMYNFDDMLNVLGWRGWGCYLVSLLTATSCLMQHQKGVRGCAHKTSVSLVFARVTQNSLLSFFMPPTSKKLRGHIGLGLSVRLSVCPSVRLSVCLSVTLYGS